MTRQVHDVEQGEGYAVADVESLGEGPAFARSAASWA